ncbi:hypothetical protein IZ6_15790 [Terrihabitans soli]|uniref:Uncharacterized protein n=1 Tax=Terrihabitans soli TaxID=708113 RepID=A0A6S6QKH2_9HYPH|nr:hypothetical protein [Terrihabitans soli]BCJ90844.1 hypothetical protein IZ6_15790 [Terrihabitans soli]
MKLITAFLVVTPLMLSVAHAEGDGDGGRRGELQRSIYEVAAGEYPSSQMFEGRAATRSEPTERLGPGGPNDPEYFSEETRNSPY